MDSSRRDGMIREIDLAGCFTLPGSAVTLNRVDYGAMQLAGRHDNKLIWGPPRDIDVAIAVLREAAASGVNHIDSADFYGPHVTKQIIWRCCLRSRPAVSATAKYLSNLQQSGVGPWNLASQPRQVHL